MVLIVQSGAIIVKSIDQKRRWILVMYSILAMGMSKHLLTELRTQHILAQHDLQFTEPLTIQEAIHFLSSQAFQLMIADLEYLRQIYQAGWLAEVRRTSFLPILVLSNAPEQDVGNVVQLGVDMCISAKHPPSVIADFAYALLRRYTKYNHYNDPSAAETAPFQVGDIYIDPPRRKVKVLDKPVFLRPREFSMLLYFMRNPKIVLTAEQICTNAWGMESGYNKGIYQPVRILRQAIEPAPQKPIYIETVWHTGYRFTAHNSETCDKC